MTPESETEVKGQDMDVDISTVLQSSPYSTPRSGRAKKKGGLAKLAEKRKRSQGMLSDVDSNYGSTVSLQTSSGETKPEPYIAGIKRDNSITEEPGQSFFDNSTSSFRTTKVLDSSYLLGSNRDRNFDKKGSIKLTVDRLENFAREFDNKDVDKLSTGSVLRENKSADLVTMDTDDKDTTDGEFQQKSPSDTTIHRFRSLKMAAERTDSVESLRNSPFMPRPPLTPRKTPPSTPKGEKRNRDPYSSGEEQDKDRTGAKAKKQLSKEKPSAKHFSNANRLPKYDEHGEREIDSMGVGSTSKQGATTVQHPDDDMGGKEFAATTSEDGTLSDEVDLTDLRRYSNPPSRMNTDHPAEKCMDIGSASDLHLLSEKYEEELAKGTLTMGQSGTISNLDHGNHGNTYPSSRGLHSSGTSRTGRLTPLSPKHPPPVLPLDISSRVLRTANKTDSTYRTSKFLNQPLSECGEKSFDTISHRSLVSTSVLPVITTKEAKARSFLMGSINSSSALLGAEELDRYFPDRKLRIFVGSWNMAEMKECAASLNDFILPDSCEYVQDMYVIGTQENSTNKKEWEIVLQETLGPSHVLFHAATHGALHLAVFIRRDLMWFCSVPESDNISTRAVTMVKTKGAVAVSFTFFGTSLLFINSHFTCDDSKTNDRISDYQKIVRGLKLPKAAATSPSSSYQADVTQKFDAVFWCGDLNFRIDRNRDHVDDILMFVTTQMYPNFENLIASDQLTRCINEGLLFNGFQEGRITFKPTYKFDLGTDKYDTSNKNRIPSYTDRVLFRSKKKNLISCVQYDAAMDISTSDHRPVFALFDTSLRPGRDNMPLAAGQFDRAVYLEANRRRALHRAAVPKNHKSSSVCSLQ